MPLEKLKTVNFDPSRKEHRAAVRAFLQRRAWGDSPIRFSYDADHSNGSLADQVQSKLLAYYMDKEKLTPAARIGKATNVGTLYIGKESPVEVHAAE